MHMRKGKTRRKLLSAIGVAAAGIGATSTASASNQYTFFNPYKFDSAVEFAKDFKSLEESEKEWVIDQLTDTELEAYGDITKPGLISAKVIDDSGRSGSKSASKSADHNPDTVTATEVQTKHPETDSILKKWSWKDTLSSKTGVRSLEVQPPEREDEMSTMSGPRWTPTQVASIKEKTITGLSTLYKWSHRMRYAKEDGDIVDIYTTDGFSSLEVGVSFEKLTEDKQKIFNNSAAISDKEAKFTQHVPYTGVKNYEGYPRIKWWGTWDGEPINAETPIKKITESNFF